MGVPAQCRMPPRLGRERSCAGADVPQSRRRCAQSSSHRAAKEASAEATVAKHSVPGVPRPAGPNSLSLGSLPVCAHARAWARACVCVCMRSLDKRAEGNECACRTRHCPWHLRGRRAAEAAAPSRRALGSQRNEATSSYTESHALSRAEQSGRMEGWSLPRGGGRRVVYVHGLGNGVGGRFRWSESTALGRAPRVLVGVT